MGISATPPCFLRDLSEELQQQMYSWGQDVERPTGNLLREQDFEWSPSKRVNGTSCYGLAWQGGHVELYTAALQWFRGLREFPGEVQRPKFYSEKVYA